MDLYKQRREAIRRRLAEFAAVAREEYFYELLYCLLTPQTSARNAARAVDRLRALSFHDREIDPESILSSPSHYIRFHKTKAKHLLAAKRKFPEVVAVLSNSARPEEIRAWLVNNVQGLGYKEATHFLRNISRSDGLAILDRHILRNLLRLGVIKTMPKTLTRKRYFEIEKRFRRFADRVGIPTDELDLLFWSMETGEILK